MMEPQFSRFRIKRLPRDHPKPIASQKPEVHQLSPSACQRCRRQKRKCSRAIPECEACELAGAICSLGEIPVASQPVSSIAADKQSESSPSTCKRTKSNHSSHPVSHPTFNIPNSLAYSPRTEPVQLANNSLSSTESGLNSRRGTSITSNAAELSVHERCVGQAARTAVDAYFRDAHRAYPFLQETRVLAILESYTSLSPTSTSSHLERDMLTLVMAIGATSILRTTIQAEAYARFLAVDYESALSNYEHQENIEALEILFLLTVFAGFDPQRVPMRPVLNSTISLMLRLNLVQKSTRDASPQCDIERNRRLFWSIYSLDRTEALSTGTPYAESLESNTVPLPSLSVDEFRSPEQSKDVATLQVTRHLIQLRRLEGKVLRQSHLQDLKGANALSENANGQELLEQLRTEIEDWYSSGCLLMSTGSDEMALHIRVSWLSGRYYNLLILLYLPSRSNQHARFSENSERVAHAQKYLHCISIAYQQHQLPLNHTTLFRLVPVFLLLTKDLISNSAGLLTNTEETLERLRFCSEVLKAYPEPWSDAHEAAHLLDSICETERKDSQSTLPQGSGHAMLGLAAMTSIYARLEEVAYRILGDDTAYLPLISQTSDGV